MSIIKIYKYLYLIFMRGVIYKGEVSEQIDATWWFQWTIPTFEFNAISIKTDYYNNNGSLQLIGCSYALCVLMVL